MKKLILTLALIAATIAVSANPIRYFTRSQAARVVTYLNSQSELMIYCGYEYELETYVLVSDVWAEPFNSAYYEIWIYGFDAYTGDEVYMPLDLGCVWLFSGNRIYSAARYLRFRTTATVPPITWYVPRYNHFVRAPHATTYVHSYHYDVHTYGWMPPSPHDGHHHGGARPLPPYYMRTPQTPAPRPSSNWTPGTDRPTVVSGNTAAPSQRPTGRSTTTTTPENSTTRANTMHPNQHSSGTGTVSGNSRGGRIGSGNTGSSSGNTNKEQDNSKKGGTATPANTQTRGTATSARSREMSTTTTATPTNRTRPTNSTTSSSQPKSGGTVNSSNSATKSSSASNTRTASPTVNNRPATNSQPTSTQPATSNRGTSGQPSGRSRQDRMRN